MNGQSSPMENLPGQAVQAAPKTEPASRQTSIPLTNGAPQAAHKHNGKDFNRLYVVLSQVNRAIVRARCREELFENVCQAALTYGGFRLAWIGWSDPQTRAVTPVACCGAAAGALARFQLSSGEVPAGEGPTGVAIREGRTVFCNSVADDPATAHNRAVSAEYGIKSAAAFPIRIENEVRGALVLYAGEPNFFGEHEVSLLEEVAEDVSFALNALEKVSGHKAAEESLQRHESLLSSFFRGSPVGLGMARDRVLFEVNERLCEMSGYSREELIGQATSLLYASQGDFEQVGRELYPLIHRQPVGTVETRWRRKDGSVCDVLLHSSVLDPSNHAAGMTFSATDITERKKAEERLRHMSRVLEQSPVSVVITDLKGTIEYVNPRFCQLTGYTLEEAVGKNPRILQSGQTPIEDYRDLWRTIKQGRDWRGQLLNRKKNGDLYWELASISPMRNAHGKMTHFLAFKEDITERKQLEEQFLRSQRMESLGTLASGVAHDLNNVLAPMMMAVELLREGERGAEDASMLKMLDQGARRGADMVRQLLAFGRGMDGQRVDLQPRPLLKEMAKIIEETFPKTIKLEKRFAEELWSVHVDATQIHQVLLNLCVNARDAMPGGGTLTLSAENTILDADIAAINPESKTGPFLLLEVADTGTGIPPGLLEKIFDPFFTTKGLGKGTGLGLSTVIGIVKNHGGFVKVASRLNEGSRFQVYLPALASEGASRLVAPSRPIPNGRGELILVVDDEESVRAIVARALEGHGYRVLVAANGAEGLMMFSKEHGAVQAVLTDVVMPVMDGGTLIRVLQNYSPGMPLIAMSGLPTQEVELSNSGARPATFLHKPFPPQQLLEALFHLLDPTKEQAVGVSGLPAKD